MAEELVTLLISDDEPAIRNGLASLPWADHGISLVGTARNGIETLRFAEENKVDIFLMDIRMPGMSGMEVGEAVLRRNPQARVIFLSGYGEFEYARRALAMQAYDYLLKPSSPSEILKCVERARDYVLRQREEERASQTMTRDLKNMSVLVAASQLVDQAEEEPGEQDIVRIVEYISQHYQEPLSLASLAEHFHFNAVYLSRYIKNHSGYTFTEILTQIRMYRAAQLLKTTTLKNGEICERIGMGDERYWGQVFKKLYGVTPNEYRRQKRALGQNPVAAILGKETD